MTIARLSHLLRGPFNFLVPEADELRGLVPETLRTLPMPQRIYLEDETATPLFGFPVLMSEGLEQLRAALDAYVQAEEVVQVGILTRQAVNRRAYNVAWERYATLLGKVVENVTISSYGRLFPAIFWLQHSLDLSYRLKDTPRRILRLDLEIGKRHGDEIKYRVFDKYIDRVLPTTYDLVNRLATDTDEVEEELFPRLLRRMFDNVLIFTEDHVGRNLAELASYFAGYLRIDGRDLRQRLERLGEWHSEQLAADEELRLAIRHLLGRDPDIEPAQLLLRPGYATFLATRRAYATSRLLPPELLQVWESLLVKLKEFELFHSLRRLILPVRTEGDHFVFRAGGLNRTWIGQQMVRLSAATRPLDFMAPWVVDPLVSRYGLIYDITDFSNIISVLRRAGSEVQDDAFRMMFRFQRRINRLAAGLRLKLEKYLGDGAFYSSREAEGLLVAAIHFQRYYSQVLAEGFAFDRGMRIGLNFGQYRLIPIQVGLPGESERYEFFGHGLVELSRLVTGKATREIEEIKIMLINQGYPEPTVHRFFAPLSQHNLDIVDKREESRRFYAYINQNGTLINEGIVATEGFIDQLERALGTPTLYRAQDGDRSYVVLPLEDADARLYVGLRKLGVAHLKGLDRLPVYEVVDGAMLAGSLEELPAGGLAAAIERDLAHGISRRSASRT